MHNKKLRETWDGKAEQHAILKKDRDQDPGTVLYEKSWWKHIEPLLPRVAGGRILEAGCGTGRWVEKLAPMGFEMVLSDISPKMLEKARESVDSNGHGDKVQFKISDIGDLRCLEDNSFDMAIATGEPVTLCESPQRAISELCRVVRPGGYVLCDAGNRYRKAYDMFRDNPSNPILQTIETGEYTNKDGLVLHMLGPEELAAIFRELGMELLTLAGITPLFTFPPNPDQKEALKHSKVFDELKIIDEKFSQQPGMVHLSSRLIAVARKPQ